jgi:hypothetical protein
MSAPHKTKLRQDLAAVLPKAGLGAAALALVAGATGAEAAISALEAAGQLVEATRLVAHALPGREAVWWACMCARHTPPATLLDDDRAAIEAAETWVRTQTDEVRRRAFDFAGRAGFNSPEAWAAVGAFWSGDSLSPLGQAAVSPPAHVAATAVAGAVALASVRVYPERRLDRLARFLSSARDIAVGGPGRLPVESEA